MREQRSAVVHLGQLTLEVVDVALRLSEDLILTEKNWWLFCLNFWQEEYCEMNNLMRSSKLRIDRGGRE